MCLIHRRTKVARVIGLLASHTTELKENVPVLEVTFFSLFKLVELRILMFLLENSNIFTPFY